LDFHLITFNEAYQFPRALSPCCLLALRAFDPTTLPKVQINKLLPAKSAKLLRVAAFVVLMENKKINK
jgi:hypothetical protein